MIPLHSRIYVAGHRGLVGSALVRALLRAGYHNLLLRTPACSPPSVRTTYLSPPRG
jgi:nucleoside-diphosphate-sugar epimerase